MNKKYLNCFYFVIITIILIFSLNIKKTEAKFDSIEQVPQINSINLKNFDKEVAIEKGFNKYLEIMQNLASKNNLQILVQQSFRLENMPVINNIVPPNSRSNHLVGHAIDINIPHNNVLYNSSKLIDYELLLQPIKNFIIGCEEAGMRWGGRFSPSDPVHFDDAINDINSKWYDEWYLYLQEQYKNDFQTHYPQLQQRELRRNQ